MFKISPFNLKVKQATTEAKRMAAPSSSECAAIQTPGPHWGTQSQLESQFESRHILCEVQSEDAVYCDIFITSYDCR